AISNPIVVICMWTAPLNVVRFGATTLWHFDAEERAPSTTSEADIVPSLAEYRGGFLRRRSQVQILHPSH
ncbi:MAG: hypothetical protein ABSB77_14875, partial [Xanthobacteraceae bacterium]